MLGPVRPTPYDLAFSVFGIPVRVVPTFWLFSALLGFHYTRVPGIGFALLLIWIAIAFVSILVHELGHALTAHLFGYPPRIMLYHFGGVAMYEPYRDYTTGKAILITLAGPAAGFLLFVASFAATFVLTMANVEVSRPVDEALGMLLFINLVWTVLNLAPVLPLDGGQVCREVCQSLNPQRGMTWALWVSIVVAALVGAGLLAIRSTYGGVMFLLMAVGNYQELQQRRHW
jgi:Zn-dependent protease